MGIFDSPLFSIGESETISFWVASGGSPQVGFSVTFLDKIGQVVEFVPLDGPFETRWRQVELDVVENSTSVFISVDDRDTQIGGWGATTSVVSEVLKSSNEINAGGLTYVGPFEAIAYPCLTPALPDGGVWPNFKYVTEEASLFSGIFGNAIFLPDVGCADPTTTCIREVDYPAATVHRRDL
jgi:hypothetical protein